MRPLRLVAVLTMSALVAGCSSGEPGTASDHIVRTAVPTQSGPRASLPASHWVGHTKGFKSRSDTVATIGYRYSGDFWFTVRPGGAVRGYAIVTYVPVVDLSGLNERLSMVKGAITGAVASLEGPWAVIGTLGTNELTSMIGGTWSADDPMPVRRGPINGHLRGNKLSVGWAGDGQRAGVKLKIGLDFLKHPDKPLVHKPFPIDAPWPGTSKVADRGGEELAIVDGPKAGKRTTRTDDYTEVNHWTWYAHPTE